MADQKKLTFWEQVRVWVRNMNLRISAKEKVAFARHLSIMAKAGLPMIKSLEMLKNQTRSRPLKKILEKVTADVNQGQFLSKSLEQFQSIFGDLFINIIRVGETAGILSENLNFLADELKKKRELQQKVIGALIYPIIILVATFGITLLLTVFIFPTIIPVFSSLNIDLPLTTRILIGTSNILTEHGPVFVLALVVFFVILFPVLRIRAVNYYWNKLLLRTPLLGGMMRNVNLSNFARTLGLTLKSEIKIVEALQVTAQSLSNPVYKKELFIIADEVQKGGGIFEYIKARAHLFPPMLAQMVSVGENTGNLSETLLYMSDFYENELTNTVKNMTNTLEPLLMVTMGIIVAFVAISIISPIYQVSQTISQ